MSADRLYTVGHGNRDGGTLIQLLSEQGIDTLVDVRSHPASRRHPQFSRDALQQALLAEGIQYHWGGQHLGGLRNPRPDSPHGALPDGLRGYADYMEADRFDVAVRQLVSLAARSPTVVMCAEREPIDCHRSILADYMNTLHGVEVIHLLDTGSWRRHQLRPELRVDSGRLVYDRHAQGRLQL